MSKSNRIKKLTIAISIFFILIVTFVTFSPSLKNGFTNWDDEDLVVNNPIIKNLSWNNIKTIFTSSYISTYIPLTILSFSVEYHFFKLNPLVYHTTNLILHLLTCIFVFWLCYVLIGDGRPRPMDQNEISTNTTVKTDFYLQSEISKRIYVSLLTALLFGIHPLRVESVAWITERKDVFYAVFFLGSLLSYLYYKKNQNIKNYYLSLILFVLAVLAKGMAITLPFVLLLCDYFAHREFKRAYLIEKIPYFAIAFVFAIIAIIIQYQTRLVEKGTFVNFPQNIFVAFYGLIFYLVKTVVPIKLSVLYPYPKEINDIFSPVVLLPIIVVTTIVMSVIFSRKYTRKIVFGSLFFLIVVLPVIGFIPVAGEAIAADRYTYIASIGLFYMLTEAFMWLYRWKLLHSIILRISCIIVLIGTIVILSFLTRQRCLIWKNSLTLWNDVLVNYQNVPDAYNGRGLYYYDNGEYDRAITDFDKVIRIRPEYIKAYYNRGNAYDAKSEYDRAIMDFTQAIRLDPNYAKSYNNRGLTYSRIGNYSMAIADITQAIRIDPDYEKAYNNRGLTYGRIGEYNKAIADFTQALNIDPEYTKACYNRAFTYFQIKEYKKAWEDIRKLRSLDYPINPDFLKALINVSEGQDK